MVNALVSFNKLELEILEKRRPVPLNENAGTYLIKNFYGYIKIISEKLVSWKPI